jgi:phosphoglucosamine mutase
MDCLVDFVKANKLDIGFAFDGDADRCLAVDENGRIIDGDLILYIYARFMQERGKLDGTKVVTTVMSNLGLYKALDELGIGYEKTDVGDRHVYENMRANGHRIGGEASGHIIFSKYSTTGDGLLTAIKVMQVVLEKKTPLSKLAEPVALYPQLMKSVRVIDKNAALADPDVRAEVAAVEKRLGGNGRILVRKSGTEPLVRIMVEAATKELCEKNIDAVISALERKELIAK